MLSRRRLPRAIWLAGSGVLIALVAVGAVLAANPSKEKIAFTAAGKGAGQVGGRAP